MFSSKFCLQSKLPTTREHPLINQRYIRRWNKTHVQPPGPQILRSNPQPYCKNAVVLSVWQKEVDRRDSGWKWHIYTKTNLVLRSAENPQLGMGFSLIKVFPPPMRWENALLVLTERTKIRAKAVWKFWGLSKVALKAARTTWKYPTLGFCQSSSTSFQSLLCSPTLVKTKNQVTRRSPI